METDLPFVDEHRVFIHATADTVWRRLIEHMARSQGGGGAQALAHVLATEPRRAHGTTLDEGATLPGFKVAEALAGQRLRLTGRHRFSKYELDLTLTTQQDGTMLSARTYAEFPGVHGWVYRQLVIGSGAHRIFVKRLLQAVRRCAATQGSGS
jgi:hypothetical protein